MTTLHSAIEDTRGSIDKELDVSRRSELGQFMTNWNIARFMSSLMNCRIPNPTSPIRILDPGAGIGSLSAALVERINSENEGSISTEVDTYEIDQTMRKGLSKTSALLESSYNCKHTINEEDFIETAVSILVPRLGECQNETEGYDFVILNPPYKKILGTSVYRHLLRLAGIETTNLYTAFWQLSIRLAKPGAQICAIVPRSFCNGTYFKSFRQYLMSSSDIKQIHVFDSRKDAFSDNDVLQENVIICSEKKGKSHAVNKGEVIVSRSANDTFDEMSKITLGSSQIWGNAPDRFLYIPTSTESLEVVEVINSLPSSLVELGLKVSTGPVVQFRLRSSLSFDGGVPMLYCSSMSEGRAKQKLENKKSPPYIQLNNESEKWLVPNSCYLIIRRFSSKEEKRRIVCAVYNPSSQELGSEMLGIDNKLNYFYSLNGPLPAEMAYGLYVFLSSTMVDKYYRLVSGHTQINSGDLRSFRYPSLSALIAVGSKYMINFSSLQKNIDEAACQFFTNTQNSSRLLSVTTSREETITNTDEQLINAA